MPQDTSIIKEKIISVLAKDGPSIPIKIAKEIESNTLFTSAFLSELVSEKRVLMSNLRIGSSALFFLSGQESMLENFAENLKSKEKEAFLLLKEKKFLKDVEQNPAIRVALREIKDFAAPFYVKEELIWRFFTVAESEFDVEQRPLVVIEKPIEAIEPVIESVKAEFKTKPKKKRKTPKKMTDDGFLNKVKNLLSGRSVEIVEVLYYRKKEVALKIKEDAEKILVAYDKKRINERDVINAAKKAREYNLPFKIFSHGDLPKKTKDFIELIKNLSSIEKLE